MNPSPDFSRRRFLGTALASTAVAGVVQTIHSHAYAHINYWGKSFLRGGPQQFGGGPVVSLYDQGAIRNIATFYQNVVSGNCVNPTPQQAGDDALTGILGREAAARATELTMGELIKENRVLEFDLTGLTP